MIRTARPTLWFMVAVAPVLPADNNAPQRDRCIAALDDATTHRELDLEARGTSDGIRTDMTVSIRPEGVAVNGSNVTLVWFIAQRTDVGKRFGEIWNGVLIRSLSAEALRTFRRDGLVIRQRLVPHENAVLRVVVCDVVSGKVGSQDIQP